MKSNAVKNEPRTHRRMLPYQSNKRDFISFSFWFYFFTFRYNYYERLFPISSSKKYILLFFKMVIVQSNRLSKKNLTSLLSILKDSFFFISMKAPSGKQLPSEVYLLDFLISHTPISTQITI